MGISDWSSDVCSSDLRAQPPACPKLADARGGNRKARKTNAGERDVYVLGIAAVDLADEAQGEVQVLRRHPARARQTAAEFREPAAQMVGQCEGDEEAHGLKLRRWREGARRRRIRDRGRCRSGGSPRWLAGGRPSGRLWQRRYRSSTAPCWSRR